MFEEHRDCIKFVLLVNVSDDERAKIEKGNPSAVIVSSNAGTELPSQVERCVDLIIFGSSVSAVAFAPLIDGFAQRDALILVEADARSDGTCGRFASMASARRQERPLGWGARVCTRRLPRSRSASPVRPARHERRCIVKE
jgi:hypothetical protein